MPAFTLLPAPTRLWARLQAGRATTADFEGLQDLLNTTLHLLDNAELHGTVEALSEVRMSRSMRYSHARCEHCGTIGVQIRCDVLQAAHYTGGGSRAPSLTALRERCATISARVRRVLPEGTCATYPPDLLRAFDAGEANRDDAVVDEEQLRDSELDQLSARHVDALRALRACVDDESSTPRDTECEPGSVDFATRRLRMELGQFATPLEVAQALEPYFRYARSLPDTARCQREKHAWPESTHRRAN